jgi:hypothetical protein
MTGKLGRIFGFSVVASLLLIAAVLYRWSAVDVRTDGGEILFLTFGGAVWLLLATKIFTWLGLSFRDDVMERRNAAALVALCGALVSAAIIYAGGSIGEGPSYWENVFSVALAGTGFFVIWVLLELVGKVSLSIAEERDFASGIRLGGFLLAAGLVLGRAVAGDWHSEEATMQDFIHDGWPAAVLLVFALLIERMARPNRQRPFPAWPSHGLFLALLYLSFAAAWLWHLGAWEGMPR